LADALGDLPLALDQASALLNETGMSVDDYLQALKDQPGETLAENHPTEYPIPMTRAWQLSVGQLEKQLPVAVDLLRVCAFFGPEPIPVDVFRRRVRSATPHLGEILGNTILRARTLRTLGRFALAHIDSRARTIQVHRLIQALLRETVAEQTAAEFRGSVHLLLASAAPANPDENEQWDRFEELVPHVEPARVNESPHPSVREFARKIVRYLYQIGDYDLALSFADQFLESWRGVEGSAADALLMEALRAQILREQGKYAEAYDTDNSVIERAKVTAGMNQRDILPIINSFGADLRARGEFQRALEHDIESVEQHSAVFGQDDARTLRSIANLALDYGLNSRYARARELHDETLNAMSEATVGVNPTSVLRAWYNLSRAVRLCGNYLEARDVGRDAYDYGQRYVRPEHLAMLRAGTDLSIALRRAGETEEALTLAREIYDRHMRLY
jgi:tetratricopeptide (TPR) repeat protein